MAKAPGSAHPRKVQDLTPPFVLLDLLRALGLGLRLEPLGTPTLDAVRARFSIAEDDDDGYPGRKDRERPSGA